MSIKKIINSLAVLDFPAVSYDTGAMNKRRTCCKSGHTLLLIVAVFLIFPVLSAAAQEQRIAFLSIENNSYDPRYDYLENMITGILLFDLSRSEGVGIVDRTDLEQVLEEQKLQLSGITSGETAARVGEILGADYLLRGNFVFLGEDLLISISLISTETAETLSFTERGYTENTIHSLAEQIVYRAAGRTITLQDAESERSIVSLRDETPGSISLYSHMIDAEIFLDGAFVGYTTGDRRVPFTIEGVKPGTHTVRTHLGGGFGVVSLPEVTFSDWEETAEVKPGKHVILRDGTKDFQSVIYHLAQIVYESVSFQADEANPAPITEDYSFTDREGTVVHMTLEIRVEDAEGDGRKVAAVLRYNPEGRSSGDTIALEVASELNREIKAEKAVGKVVCGIRINHRNDLFTITYAINRTDVYPNMWRE